MAIIRVKAPINPDEPVIPKVKRKKYDDDLSVQPSAKMISERVFKYGLTKVPHLIVSFPVTDEELTNQLHDAIPTMVRSEKLKDYYEMPEDGVIPDDAEPIRLVEYRCPHTLENIAAVYKFGITHRFVFDGDIAVRAMASTEEGKELERMSYAKTNSTFQVAKMNGTPYPFQIPGVAYMVKTKKCINADEMGLGKTVEAILATATVKAYPALMIVPNQLKTTPWKRLWNQWAPRRKATTLVMDNKNKRNLTKGIRVRDKRTKKFEIRKPEVVIVNYDRLGKYMKYLKKVKWRAIILDESHYVKNHNAHRTRACIELVDAVKPEYVWLLSGTPIKAKPEHLVAQLRIIDRLKDFGGRGNFMKRYCFTVSPEEEYDLKDIDIREMAKKRHETSIELNRHLRSLCYLRRDKAEVLHDLPAKTRSTLKFKLNAEWRAKYTQVETDLVSYLLDRAMQDEKFLASIKKLSKKEREFAISEYRSMVEYKTARAEILQKIEMCKQVAAAGKLEAVKEWIESFLESDEKLVTFMTHKIILQELAEEFPKIHMEIMGNQDARADEQDKRKFKLDDDATVRDAEVARFQLDPKCKLGLCMIQAGGVGHTLTAASNVAFIELPWGPTDCDQAEDRCHRIGQKDNVTCWYLLAENTIDEPIAELIESKRMVVNAVHDGDPLHGMEQGNILSDLVKVLTRGKVVLLR